MKKERVISEIKYIGGELARVLVCAGVGATIGTVTTKSVEGGLFGLIIGSALGATPPTSQEPRKWRR